MVMPGALQVVKLLQDCQIIRPKTFRRLAAPITGLAALTRLRRDGVREKFKVAAWRRAAGGGSIKLPAVIIEAAIGGAFECGGVFVQRLAANYFVCAALQI